MWNDVIYKIKLIKISKSTVVVECSIYNFTNPDPNLIFK